MLCMIAVAHEPHLAAISPLAIATTTILKNPCTIEVIFKMIRRGHRAPFFLLPPDPLKINYLFDDKWQVSMKSNSAGWDDLCERDKFLKLLEKHHL
jgi:hypothetical protein